MFAKYRLQQRRGEGGSSKGYLRCVDADENAAGSVGPTRIVSVDGNALTCIKIKNAADDQSR